MTSSRWLVRLASLLSLLLLWWLTAQDDAESALWRAYGIDTAATNVAISAVVLGAAYILDSPRQQSVRAARVTLVIFGMVCALGALEVPAALLGHDYGHTLGTRANDTWLQLSMGVNRRDEDLLHLHQPHTRYQGMVHGNLAWLGIPRAARYAVDITYDRNGFRNNEDLDEADVVAIGDSFIEGAEVPQEETLAAHLRRRLGVTVANLGQSNYGPQQELVVLERYGVPLRPKTVIWFFFGGNDLADAELYEWRRGHLDEWLAPPSLSSRSFTRNALLKIARMTTPERRRPSAAARLHAAQFTRRDGTTEVMYLDASEGPWTPRQWELASSTLVRAHDVTRRIGADLIVVYIPRKLRVYRGFLRAEPGTYAETWTSNNLPDVLGGWCRERGIEFIDSTIPLRAAVASGESVYLPDDVHWNLAGHRTVADAVAERVRELGRGRARSTSN